VQWVDRFRMAPGLREIAMSADIALAAAMLPSDVHGDPADRFLIATARLMGIPLLTSDRRVIDYAGQGILDVIAYSPELERIL
jgi:PIN domain nuclease of toxin-antitoxin system